MMMMVMAMAMEMVTTVTRELIRTPAAALRCQQMWPLQQTSPASIARTAFTMLALVPTPTLAPAPALPQGPDLAPATWSQCSRSASTMSSVPAQPWPARSVSLGAVTMESKAVRTLLTAKRCILMEAGGGASFLSPALVAALLLTRHMTARIRARRGLPLPPAPVEDARGGPIGLAPERREGRCGLLLAQRTLSVSMGARSQRWMLATLAALVLLAVPTMVAYVAAKVERVVAS